MPPETVTFHGKSYNRNDLLLPWLGRKDDAYEDRKQYMNQVKINRCFAAGKQHLSIHARDGRVVEVKERAGVRLVQSNILDQYLLTVLGRMSATDYKPNFLVAQNNAAADEIAAQINQAFSWGWDYEWEADEKIIQILRHMIIDGTVAVRSRYDRKYGELVGDMPYKDGTPILDKEEAAKYIAEKAGKGETADIRPVREGKIRWELLTMDNLLTPPSQEFVELFPWLIINRPVSVAELKHRYGKLAEEINSEDLEENGTLTASYTDGEATKIKDKAMTYTGYEMPNDLHPKGRTVVFTETAILDCRDSLPLSQHPLGPRCGVHFFRWQVLPGRFWGKAFIQNGIDGQKIYNKRLTQMDSIIDRNMPKTFIEEQSLARSKTGEPFEYIEVRPGAPLPKVDAGIQLGGWWIEEIKLQEQAVEKALGIRGVSMGQAPTGVSAYSAMALLTENDSLKLDAIASEFGLAMDALCWDTMEQMRNWPSQKQMLISGPEDRLQEFIFRSNDIPEQYLVKRTRGTGSVPRSQAAEIQKINDIWAAAAGRLPLSWYVDSLNAGKPQDLPPSIADTDLHKAELENILIESTYQAPPVAPYDDDAKHVEVHRAGQAECQARADAGDPTALMCVQVYEEHIQEHERSAAAGQAIGPQAAQMPPPMGMPGLNNGNPGGAPLAPAGMEGLGSEPTGYS